MKAYALTEDELSTLGALQGLAAFFFALGGTCLGLWFNIELQVAFADDVEKHVTSYWEGLQFAAIVAAFIFGALGVVIFAYNGWRVRRIKKSTLH